MSGRKHSNVNNSENTGRRLSLAHSEIGGRKPSVVNNVTDPGGKKQSAVIPVSNTKTKQGSATGGYLEITKPRRLSVMRDGGGVGPGGSSSRNSLTHPQPVLEFPVPKEGDVIYITVRVYPSLAHLEDEVTVCLARGWGDLKEAQTPNDTVTVIKSSGYGHSGDFSLFHQETVSRSDQHIYKQVTENAASKG